MNRIKRNMVLMGILNLLMDLKLYGVIAIIYYTKVAGNITLGMSIFSITMIASAIFEVPTGVISDKVGRKKTIMIGTIMSLIYAIIFAMSKNYTYLIIAAIFEGLEQAFFSGNNEAYIYDILKESNRQDEYNKYLGKTHSMYQVASMVGGIAGTVLLYFTSYSVIMWISVVPKVINVFVSFMLDEPKVYTKNKNNIYEQTVKAFKIVVKDKAILKQIIADGISQGSGEATFQFRSKFYEMVWPTWALGIPGVLANLGNFLANWFSHNILKKVKNKTLIIRGYIYSILSNVVGVFLNNVISPIVLVSNSVIPTYIAEEEIAQKLYSDEYRASIGSIKSLFSSILVAVFALLVGIIADNMGVIYAIAIMQIPKLVTIGVYINIFKNNKQLIK